MSKTMNVQNVDVITTEAAEYIERIEYQKETNPAEFFVVSKIKEGDSILDYQCRTARINHILKCHKMDDKVRYFGVDNEFKFMEIAKRKFPELKLKYVPDLGFFDFGAVDILICNNRVNNQLNPVEYIESVMVLKYDKAFFILPAAVTGSSLEDSDRLKVIDSVNTKIINNIYNHEALLQLATDKKMSIALFDDYVVLTHDKKDGTQEIINNRTVVPEVIAEVPKKSRKNQAV